MPCTSADVRAWLSVGHQLSPTTYAHGYKACGLQAPHIARLLQSSKPTASLELMGVRDGMRRRFGVSSSGTAFGTATLTPGALRRPRSDSEVTSKLDVARRSNADAYPFETRSRTRRRVRASGRARSREDTAHSHAKPQPQRHDGISLLSLLGPIAADYCGRVNASGLFESFVASQISITVPGCLEPSGPMASTL